MMSAPAQRSFLVLMLSVIVMGGAGEGVEKKSMLRSNETSQAAKKAIIADILDLKKVFPHFRNLKASINDDSLLYENGGTEIPNPNFERESKAYLEETKKGDPRGKRRLAYRLIQEPSKTITKWNEKDGIRFSLGFLDPTSQMISQFWIGRGVGNGFEYRRFPWGNWIANLGSFYVSFDLEGGAGVQKIFDEIIGILKKHYVKSVSR